jgi:hypothetical protein
MYPNRAATTRGTLILSRLAETDREMKTPNAENLHDRWRELKKATLEARGRMMST